MSIFMNFSKMWSINNNGAYTRSRVDGDVMTDPQTVFSNIQDNQQLLKILNKINGFWGAVILHRASNTVSECRIISDRIRSFPVFYACRGRDLYIGNDCHWVLERYGLDNVDEEAKQEFSMSLQITGTRTLFKGLYQLQAGEIVLFKWDEVKQEWGVKHERYYKYLLHMPIETSEKKLFALFDKVMYSSFERLCRYADGRTIVIPLSGGYDSRLILLMLKTLGYKNIVTFSYGARGNEEACISEETAKELNVPWIFIEYRNAELRELSHSAEMMDFKRYAGNYASLPHTQDWFAVKVLHETHMIPEDSIFVAGYSGDLPSGSRSKMYPQLYTEELSIDQTIHLLTKFLYQISEKSFEKKVMRTNEEHLKSLIGDAEQYINPVSLFVSMDIAERQAKYINNAVRVYEFWGYNWWTPYWDRDFLNFWANTPLTCQFHQKLYIEYLVYQSQH